MKTPIAAAVSLLAMGAGALSAQTSTFTTQILERNLASPTGIVVGPSGDLYFTEVPTPGVMGAMSQNTVKRRDRMTGMITTVAAGEPEPTNLAFEGSDLYWTCKSAGVIIQRSNGSNSVWMQGLQQPSGIDSGPNGEIYITEIPTPGMSGSAGGTNSVSRVDNAMPRTLSTGEPEPVDVATDAAGNLYWTCRTAGVILRYDIGTRQTSMLLNGLERPTGLDIDAAGNLYFSEIPTPGVSGTAGGRNSVWRYEPSTALMTLIGFGEPEPADVAVTPDGQTVYWTCTTAGVIIRADLTGMQPSVTTQSSTAPGDTVQFDLLAGGLPGMAYGLGNSAGRGPIPVGSDLFGLELDSLLTATFASTSSAGIMGYRGQLDMNGRATASLMIPNLATLSGVDIYTAFAVFDATGIVGLSRTLRFEIQ